jgi:hypothetical protein
MLHEPFTQLPPFALFPVKFRHVQIIIQWQYGNKPYSWIKRVLKVTINEICSWFAWI